VIKANGVQSRPSSASRSVPQGRRTRVLHVIQNLNYGGMERLLADIVAEVSPERFESHVLVLDFFGRFAQGLEPHATLHRAGRMSPLSMVRPASLIRQIRAIAPDVVHTHSGVWYKISLAARGAGVPRLIHTDHGRASPDPLHARMLDSLAARRTDVVVAVSEALAQQLAATVVRGATPIEVVRNGVDTELHRPRADTGRIRLELGVGAEVPIVGSIGRLEPIKGYDVMVDAFARLLAQWPGGEAPRLVIAGDGSQRQRLLHAAREHGIAEQVHLLGWRDDVHDLHSAFTLFTMSSRSEGTSVSLLEAMSAGLCPVVTDVGGNAAVLGGALRHRLVPPEDPEALAAAWRDVLLRRDRSEQDGAAARQRVIEAFSLAAMVERYQQLYLTP
jgi:glycosyltransferase involved in cell wall biosynthesis